MFDHITIRVADGAASERFYNTVLRPLGIDETYRTGSFLEWQDFSLTAAEPDGGVIGLPREQRWSSRDSSFFLVV